jgi:NADPH2:quinone reductase
MTASTRTHAMRVHRTGGPEALQWEEIDLPAPGPGEALLRQTAIGVNFIDVYERTGYYPLPLPFVPGGEGAGVVEAVGPGVTGVAVGDRVAYQNVKGAYAERRLVPADRLVRLPDDIDDRQAAAMLLKGMTAQYLLRRTFPVEAGQTILFHAAAGGVGSIACQWAASLGATVIGTVGSAAKAELAREHGCAHVINYRTENFVDRVREITGGKGVAAVYDSVGADTFPASLDVLQPRGIFVSFGQSSGPVPPLTTQLLLQKGSLYVTRPTLAHYAATREDLESTADDLFAVVLSGRVKILLNQTFPLAEAADAHRALEGRQTTGATVLLP